MFSENDRVSGNQIKKMLIFDMISISVLMIPGISANLAGRDGIIAIIAGSIAAVLYSCFFLFVSKRIEGDYIVNVKKIFGNVFGVLINMLYMAKILISCWFTLSLFSNVIIETLLPNTEYQYIFAAFLLTGVYMASKGIEVRARVTEVLFFLIIIPLSLIFIFSLKNIDVVNLFPLFMTNGETVLRTSYTVLLTFSSLELLLFILPYVTRLDAQEGKHRKGIMWAVAVTAIMNIILFILIVGTLGIKDAGQQFDSSIAILQVMDLPFGFSKRQDAVILLLWLFMVFTIISGFFYYLSKIGSTIVKTKSRYGQLLMYAGIIFFLCFIRIEPDKMIHYFTNYMAYIGLPQSILLPLLLLVVKRIRKQ